MVPEHAGAVGVGGRAQAGECAAQVIGRGDRVIGVGGLLVDRVQDGLHRVVAGRAARAADDQRVGPRGRDRSRSGARRWPRRRRAVALPSVARSGSSTVIVPIRVGSVTKSERERLTGGQGQRVGVGIAGEADAPVTDGS